MQTLLIASATRPQRIVMTMTSIASIRVRTIIIIIIRYRSMLTIVYAGGETLRVQTRTLHTVALLVVIVGGGTSAAATAESTRCWAKLFVE
jgi:hypothetical protein